MRDARFKHGNKKKGLIRTLLTQINFNFEKMMAGLQIRLWSVQTEDFG